MLGLLLLLSLLTFSLCDYGLTNKTSTDEGDIYYLETLYGTEDVNTFKTIRIEVRYYDEDIMNIRIVPTDVERYTTQDVMQVNTLSKKPTSPELTFNVNQLKPFLFSVTDETGSPLFNFNASTDDEDAQLFVEDQFLQISTHVPTGTTINGFGIRYESFSLEGGADHPLWTMEPNGVDPNINIYSAHPFAMLNYPPDIHNTDYHSVGLLFNNSNACQLITPSQTMAGNLIYRTIGGIIDLTIIKGPSPDEVVRKYHTLIGKPYFHPRWSLGISQCSFEYLNVNDFREMVKKYEENNIPLDIVFSDVNIMDKHQDFTIEPRVFGIKNMQEFIQELHEKYMKYVPILDPGIKYSTENRWYNQMVSTQPEDWAYVKCPVSDTPIVNSCWPGEVIMPDFTSPYARNMWAQWVYDFNYDEEAAPFDGLWIDMNDPSTFCTGECSNAACVGEKTSEMEKLSNPYYTIGHKRNMEHETLDLASRQYLGNHYDLHNMYAFYESIATRDGLDRIHENENQGVSGRSLLLSRGSFLGSGRYTGSWLGDNASTYEHLKSSVSMIQQANLHGISLAGPDVGGFMKNAWEELVVRWYGLAVLYPFLRNHYSLGTKRQEPYQYSQTAMDSIGEFMRLRYSFTPYLYTELYRVHRYGGMIWKPIYYEYQEESIYAQIFEDTSLVGSNLYLAAVPAVDSTSMTVPIPVGTCWRDIDGNIYTSDATVNTPLDRPAPIFFKCGTAVIRQHPADRLITTNLKPMYLTISMPSASSSSKLHTSSMFYYDDGSTTPGFDVYNGVDGTGSYIESEITVDFTNEKSFKICNKIVDEGGAISIPVINQIELLGIGEGVSYTMNGITGKTISGSTPFSSSGVIHGLDISLRDEWCIDVTISD